MKSPLFLQIGLSISKLTRVWLEKAQPGQYEVSDRPWSDQTVRLYCSNRIFTFFSNRNLKIIIRLKITKLFFTKSRIFWKFSFWITVSAFHGLYLNNKFPSFLELLWNHDFNIASCRISYAAYLLDLCRFQQFRLLQYQLYYSNLWDVLIMPSWHAYSFSSLVKVLSDGHIANWHIGT